MLAIRPKEEERVKHLEVKTVATVYFHRVVIEIFADIFNPSHVLAVITEHLQHPFLIIGALCVLGVGLLEFEGVKLFIP
jgi:hypothetical protein